MVRGNHDDDAHTSLDHDHHRCCTGARPTVDAEDAQRVIRAPGPVSRRQCGESARGVLSDADHET
jgi:hypothetical protein